MLVVNIKDRKELFIQVLNTRYNDFGNFLDLKNSWL